MQYWDPPALLACRARSGHLEQRQRDDEVVSLVEEGLMPFHDRLGVVPGQDHGIIGLVVVKPVRVVHRDMMARAVGIVLHRVVVHQEVQVVGQFKLVEQAGNRWRGAVTRHLLPALLQIAKHAADLVLCQPDPFAVGPVSLDLVQSQG